MKLRKQRFAKSGDISYLAADMAGIYIHVPFCKRKCVYCDFYSTAQYDRFGHAFIDAAIAEMHRSKDYIGGESVNTIYFGGGTPSLFDPGDIRKLVEEVKDVFHTPELTETTLEANPEDIDAEYLTGLRQAGIDRLSIGIQSFDDGLLSFMKRRHNALKAQEAVKLARKSGFGNISIDLIYGIPGQDISIWKRTLEKAISLNPEHISAYHLSFEPSTVLGRRQAAGKIAEVPDEQSQIHFELLHRMLTAAGYEHYEVSNFAKPGFRSRHNSAYWTGGKYLGIGPGAHSFDGRQRQWCGMSVADYVSTHEMVYGSEILTPDDIYNETIMTSLRCSDGIHTDTVIRRAGEKYAALFTASADKLVTAGRLRRDGGRYYIGPEDFLTSDNVIASLFI